MQARKLRTQGLEVSAAYLEENTAAAEVELSAGDLDRLERAFPAGAAADRYPDMSTVNR